jgi:DNA polymerase-3 subunit gamma/tau
MDLSSQYRPTTLEEVYGQTLACESLKATVGTPYTTRAYLLSGPSGVGKTTFARIIAKMLECQDYKELDAATRTGVGDVRELLEELKFAPMTQNGVRVICLDEAHMLSKSAWNALLKVVEEPPHKTFWIFCTTEPSKVPQTIKTRCTHYPLTLLADRYMEDLIFDVAAAESIKLDDTLFDALLEYAAGSPRQALEGLGKIRGVANPQDAIKLLGRTTVDKEAIELCRALARGANWPTATKIVRGIEPGSVEGVRIAIYRYFLAIALKSTGQKAAQALTVMEAFSEPYTQTGDKGPLLLSLGELLL